ncbi:MAG: hypothetical protein OXC83_08395 [Chloroflexi bacterium]|nr:hypothetical protein [Chloroflexota bacterium]
MDFQALLADALPLVVALLTILTAGGGIGLWIGTLSSRQKHAETRLERLEQEFDELFTLRDTSASTRLDEIQEFLRTVRRRP